ncbi:MAG: PRC-barrel domain-containing protein [Planctomycetia bacterium]|nr:PRC-barrel domain-containing protein [Planctomycetia bacterium]
MTSKLLRIASAALLVTFSGLTALTAEPQKNPLPPGKAPPAAPTFRAKQVLGSKILIQNNTAVGTVEDLVFDDAGNMEYLIVSTSDKKLITVPWDATKFDLEKKTATIIITQERFKTIPTYTVTTYPQFYTPAYRTEVYKFYGLTPRELRRLERKLP